MAYDAATGTVVLFGGEGKPTHVGGRDLLFDDTWTWDGTTWTRQHPAVHPPALTNASMAYDAATSTVVLFGGYDGERLGQTWTWDGTTWTRQQPAARPPARFRASMAYDAATGTVVLFGGLGLHGTADFALGDTWTWDGTAWTRQHPAASPSPRDAASMAYDTATSTVVLFGGSGRHILHEAQTWTWDGTTWTKQTPGTSPPGRIAASMAYDAATGTVVLFGGVGRVPHGNRVLADTWTWDGTTWTQQTPATSPPGRDDAAMAYDGAASTVVLFGGHRHGFLADTWTWG
jgi:hypothetical protein